MLNEVINVLIKLVYGVDKKMGIDVYEQIPVMESEKFLLREIKDGDAEDLLRVYSDKDAVPLF